MGYYTELHCKIRLRKDTPEDIISLLKKVLIDKDLGLGEKTFFQNQDVFKPEVKDCFFNCERWYMLLDATNWDKSKKGGSLCHDNGYWTVELDTEFKNYDDEIELFVKWISQYVVGRKKKQYIGWNQGEDDPHRTNLYINRNRDRANIHR